MKRGRTSLGDTELDMEETTPTEDRVAAVYSAGVALATEQLNKALRNSDSAELEFFGIFIQSLLVNKPPNIVGKWLSWLSCGSEPKAVTDALLETQTERVCGAVLKGGDYAYSCEDCQMDDSCIICKACYDPSKHVGHRIGIIKVGGGCCDCGDSEAWSPAGFCNVHGGHVEDEDPAANFPPEFKASLAFVSRHVFKTLQAALCTDAKIQLILWNLAEATSKRHSVVVLDDDKHTFQEVTQHLVKICRVTKAEATSMTLRIDAAGFAVVSAGTLEECNVICDKLKQFQLDAAVRSDTEFITIARLNAFFKWIGSFCDNHEGIREIFAKEFDPRQIVSKYDSFDHAVQKTVHDFFFGMMKNRDFKIKFGICLSQAYVSTYEYLSHSPVSHNNSILGFSVQLFTQPNLTPKLVIEHKLLENVFEAMYRLIDPDTGLIDLDSREFISKATPYYILKDLEYLFSLDPVLEWTFSKKEQLQSWVGIQCCLQHCLPLKRKLRSHVAVEKDSWTRALNLTLDIKTMLASFKNFLARRTTQAFTQESTLLLSILQEYLEESFDTDVAAVKDWKNVGPDALKTIDFKVGGDKAVTLHIPLQRLFSMIFLMRCRQTPTVKAKDLIAPCEATSYEDFVLQLIQMPLRALVFARQAKLGMWVRNGSEAEQQVYHYFTPRFREAMFEMDVALLQICSTLFENHDYFLFVVLDAFDSIDILLQFNPDAIPNKDDKKVEIAEGALTLITTLIAMRTQVGQMSEEQIIRENLIQKLFLGRSSHTELAKLFENAAEKPIFGVILKEIADFSEASGFQSGGYTLKPQFMKEYIPHWPFYASEDAQTAQEKYYELQDQEAKKQGKSISEMQHRELPKPYTLLPAFASLAEIYHSKVLHSMIFTVLVRAQTNDKRQYSLAMVDLALHIIQLGLIETNQITTQFFSLTEKKAGEISILSLLFGLLKDATFVRQHSAINWILQQLPKKNAEFTEIVSQLSAAAQPTEKKMTPEEEREMRKQRALAARKRANEKLDQTTQKLTEKISQTENLTKSEDGAREGEQPAEVIEMGEVECILCQENHDSHHTHPFGAVSLIQSSSVPLCSKLTHKERGLLSTAVHPFKTNSSNLTSCGHFIHFKCYDKLLSTIQAKVFQGDMFSGRYLNVEQGYFECPLCKRVSNCVVPRNSIKEKEFVPLPSLDITAFPTAPIKGPSDLDADLHQLVTSPGVMKDMLEGLTNRVTCLSHSTSFPLSTEHTYLLKDLRHTLKNSIANLEIAARLPTNHRAGYCQVDWSISLSKDAIKENLFHFLESVRSYHVVIGFSQSEGFDFKSTKLVHQILNGETTSHLGHTLLAQDMLDFLLTWAIESPLLTGTLEMNSLCAHFRTMALLTIQASLIQSLISLLLQNTEEQEPQDSLGSPLFPGELINVVKDILQIRADVQINHHKVLSMSLPYLRQCSIFKGILYSEAIPQVHDTADISDEYANLLKFLALPSLNEFFDGSEGSLARKNTIKWTTQLVAVAEQVKLSNQKLVQQKEEQEKQATPQVSELSVKELRQIFTDNKIDFSNCLEKSDMIQLFVSSGLKVPSAAPATPQPKTDLVLLESDWKGFIPMYSEVKRFELISLPENYIDLILQYEDQDHKTPCICLCCSTLLIPGKEVIVAGKKIGALTHHAMSCGGGQGLFMELNAAAIIAQTIEGLYELPTPYLDAHGQVVNGLKRGRPLTLRQDRYERLRLLYVLHQIGLVDSVKLALTKGVL